MERVTIWSGCNDLLVNRFFFISLLVLICSPSPSPSSVAYCTTYTSLGKCFIAWRTYRSFCPLRIVKTPSICICVWIALWLNKLSPWKHLGKCFLDLGFELWGSFTLAPCFSKVLSFTSTTLNCPVSVCVSYALKRWKRTAWNPQNYNPLRACIRITVVLIRLHTPCRICKC